MALKYTDEVYAKNFDKLKSQQSITKDASRKASIDEHIKTLVELINNSENYFTTSSCSGRLLVFAQVNQKDKLQRFRGVFRDDCILIYLLWIKEEIHVKKNCEWIKVTHDPLDQEQIEEFV
jgi:tRNA(Phe) wybutosine-synthesizing methylase Tyw3